MRPAPTGTIRDLGGLVFARELPEGASFFDCLLVAWDEARWEARCTYDEWHGMGGMERYFVYRAAQDRADAAQDALAQIALAQVPQPAL
jgi:hypothetical protein